MAARFQFDHSLAFEPDRAAEILRTIPTLPGVFALRGPRAPEGQQEAQPYVTRAADLRRRITRILAPPDSQSKRLNLRSRVARIDYSVTGSEFESTFTLYHASAAIFGLDQARRRLHLRTPFFLRFTAENAYPRVYSTNRLSKRTLDCFYGPFPSRAAADRYCDAVLDLFKLRRCVEDLAPYPEHPGCVYGEMNKCLAPCNQACTPVGAAAYAAEAAAVQAFFDTHGESMLAPLAAERGAASTELAFERAAELHVQWQKVKAAAALADPLVQPISNLRAIIVQKAVPPPDSSPRSAPPPNSVILSEAPELAEGAESMDLQSAVPGPAAAIFLLYSGCLSGPERLSTLGVRAVKEQTSVGSALFAQPLMLQPISLEAPDTSPVILNEITNPQDPVILSEDATEVASESKDLRLPSNDSAPTTLSPELCSAALIASLESEASAPTDLATLSDHLSLLRRWYYRPEKQRAGEIFFPKENSADQTTWPIRRILNAAARAALGDPETQRAPAKS